MAQTTGLKDSDRPTALQQIQHRKAESECPGGGIENTQGAEMANRWRKIAVALLFVVFGWSSWIDVNGLWVELPLMVQKLPESWNLPSYFVVIIQLANIGPLAYGILSWLMKKYQLSSDVNPLMRLETGVIYTIIVVGFISTLLLSFYWDVTSVIGGVEHSTVLLILVFFLSLVDCTSSVTFLPFLAHFKPSYMTAFYIGEGMSGLIPTALAFIQGSGEYTCVNQTTNSSQTNYTLQYSLQPQYNELLFPVQDFFVAIFVMLLLSFVAFTLLKFTLFAKKEIAHNTLSDSDSSSYEPAETSPPEETLTKFSPESSLNSASPIIKADKSDHQVPSPPQMITDTQYYALLAVIGSLAGLANGALPSIQIYSLLPYGQIYYSLGVKLSTIANPLACFIGFFLIPRSMITIGVMYSVSLISAVYIIVIASYSPVPPTDSVTAAVFMVLIWVIFVGVVSYMKVIISVLMMERGHSALFWTGVATQIGSFIAAIIAFICTSVLNLLQQAPLC